MSLCFPSEHQYKHRLLDAALLLFFFFTCLMQTSYNNVIIVLNGLNLKLIQLNEIV